MERGLVSEANLPFRSYHEIYAGPLHSVNLLKILISLIKLFIGLLQSLFLVLSKRPASILLTGGWANVPLAVAGWLARIPIVVYLPDIEPGLTIRVLKYFATKVAITVDESSQHFRRGQSVVTGYPLRENHLQASQAAAIERFDLDPSRKTLLVTGGSRGARSINITLEKILTDLLEENLQIIHVTGTLDWERSQDVTKHLNLKYYHAYPYLHHDMGLAMVAADIVLSRSGASTLGELPYFGAAAILVPYPYAWRYQKVNADYLEQRGAAIRLNDEDMNAKLLGVVQELIADSEMLEKMRENMRQMRTENGADRVAQVLLAVAEESE